MKRQLGTFLLVSVIVSICAQTGIAKEASAVLKQHERNSISLELEFSKKNQNPLQRVISFLNWGPNGYATGFLVGGRLVITAYHVVSGDELSVYFGSDRPGSAGFDIWEAHRTTTGDGFGTPRLSTNVNSTATDLRSSDTEMSRRSPRAPRTTVP